MTLRVGRRHATTSYERERFAEALDQAREEVARNLHCVCLHGFVAHDEGLLA